MLNGKFLITSSVTDQPIRLRNNQFLISRNALDSGDVSIIKINALNEIELATRPIVTGLGALALLSEISGATFFKDSYTVPAPLAANTPVALTQTPTANSVLAFITSGPILDEGVDYTVSGSTLTLLIASPVIQLLTTGEKIVIQYAY